MKKEALYVGAVDLGLSESLLEETDGLVIAPRQSIQQRGLDQGDRGGHVCDAVI